MTLETEGFNQEVLDKVYRIADVLQRVGHVPFLRNRMSFSGGTALNFIIFQRIERLSVDLDFNFREVPSQTDWKEDRSNVDKYIKQILYDLKYNRDDIKINASYPLTRFEVKYPTNKSFKIEIAYTRRFPVLPSDEIRTFSHPRTNETCEILIPKKEELFGNKCSVLLARKTSRDLFDVSRIALQDCNSELVRKTLVLDNMMQAKENFANINIKNQLKRLQLDDRLRQVVRGGTLSRENFQEIIIKASGFLIQLQNNLTHNEKDCLRQFFEEYKFKPELLGSQEFFHPRLDEHPNILRSLQVLKS